MRIYNSDGSEPEMCGNGIRCLSKFVADVDKSSPKKFKVHTLAGLIQPELLSDGQVKVDMGVPILEGPKIPTTLKPTTGHTVLRQKLVVDGKTYEVSCVSMGNPHAVVYSYDGKSIKLSEINKVLETLGPKFECNPVFPRKTNTEFVEVITSSHVKMLVWERGAGRTLACGTGTCALVVAGILEGRIDRSQTCLVDLPGGPLQIFWDKASNHVFMTGPAEFVFAGEVSV